jgi:prolyl 4-hydroxylase
MKRLILDNNQINFIGSWKLDDDNISRNIINFFEENLDLQKDGSTGDGKNFNIKKTTDMNIHPKNLQEKKFSDIKNYMNELHKCYLDYQEQWPFLKDKINTVDIPTFNIQKYNPGDHFSHIHSERSSLNSLHRVFAWMTYLNDVNDGGNTYFSHYNLKIKPEIGKTLIWPAEWTHAHCGEVLNSGVKYIITGWMHFPTNK